MSKPKNKSATIANSPSLESERQSYKFPPEEPDVKEHSRQSQPQESGAILKNKHIELRIKAIDMKRFRCPLADSIEKEAFSKGKDCLIKVRNIATVES